jgi:hypothetical protein
MRVGSLLTLDPTYINGYASALSAIFSAKA